MKLKYSETSKCHIKAQIRRQVRKLPEIVPNCRTLDLNTEGCCYEWDLAYLKVIHYMIIYQQTAYNKPSTYVQPQNI